MHVRSYLLLAICFFALAVTAQVVTPQPARHPVKDAEKEIKLGEDEVGCKDSTLLNRIQGCSIIQCDTKPEAEGVELQVGASQDGDPQKEAMDGSAEVIYYLCPAKMAAASIKRGLEANLIANGFKVIYSGHDGDDMPLVTALKDTQWIQISTYMYNDNAAYIQTALKVAPEDTTTPESLAEEINKNGRVVVTGINFRGDDLAPDSERILAEVQAFLTKVPDLKVKIEAYTDSTGDKATNLDMTQKRASSIATWLSAHGVDKGRISAAGMGDARPIGDNSTPEGQAKNRRIELVKN